MRCHDDDSSFSTAGDRTTITAALTDEDYIALIVRAATKKQEDELEALREEVRQLRLETRRLGEKSGGAAVASPPRGGERSNGSDTSAVERPVLLSSVATVSSDALDDDVPPETVRAMVREELGPVIAALANIQNKLDDDAPRPTISRREAMEMKLDSIRRSLGDTMTKTLDEAVGRIETRLQGIEAAIQAPDASVGNTLGRPEALSQDVRAVREEALSEKQEILDSLQGPRDCPGNARRAVESNGGSAIVPGASSELLSAGEFHSLALRNDGTVNAWGSNDHGELTVPSCLSSVTSVSAGSEFSLALKTDGTITAWGRNDGGQSTVPAHLSAVTKVAAGGCHSLALLANKKVVAWGYNHEGQTTVPENLENVKAIAAGALHSLVLLENGTVTGWGWDAYGQASVPAELEGVKAITAGYGFSLALKNDGTVVAWGGGSSANVPVGLGPVEALSAKCDHSLALLENGTVEAWGENEYGETDVPQGLESVVAVAAGYRCSLAMKANGSIVGWGRNDYGEVTIPEELRAP